MARRFSLLPLLLAALCARAGAQDDATPASPAKPEPPKRTIRLLPVGDAPPFRQEVRDGVRYELEPPPGSIPPRQVTLERGPHDLVSLRLLLGQQSQPVTLPLALHQVAVRAGEDKPWLNLALPDDGDQLVVLWRDATQGTWKYPRCVVLPESTYPVGSVRIVNTTRAEMNVAFGQETATVAPEHCLLKHVGITDNFPVQFAWTPLGGGPKKIFYSNALTMEANERGQLILYRTDGAEARLPVKVIFLREKTQPPPPPPSPPKP